MLVKEPIKLKFLEEVEEAIDAHGKFAEDMKNEMCRLRVQGVSRWLWRGF
jgi:hypothetical protein